MRYDGGRRRRPVSATMTRTGRVSSEATPASPARVAGQTGVCRVRGSVRPVRFARKQLSRPEPLASARSAVPLPVTVLPKTRFPRGRHGGPGARNGGIEADVERRREHRDPVALAANDPVPRDHVVVPSGHRHADPHESCERGPDRYRRAPAPGDGVANDRRPRLWRKRLVRVRVGDDPGSVAVPGRVADHDSGRVRPRRSPPRTTSPRRGRPSPHTAGTRRRSRRRRRRPRRSRGRASPARRPRRRCRSHGRSTR